MLLLACRPDEAPEIRQTAKVPEAGLQTPVSILEEGAVDVRTAPVGQRIAYGLQMAAGEIFHLRIEQRGLDIAIHWPQEARPIDLLFGKYVVEELWWYSAAQAELRFDIEVLGGVGDYRLEVPQLGPADAQDRLRAETFWRGRTASVNAPTPAFDTRLAELATAWHRAEVPMQEALIWARLGVSRQGQRALTAAGAAFDQALTLLNQQSVGALGARIRLQRGNLYREIGDYPRAAVDLLAAAAETQQTGDLYGLAVAISDLALTWDAQGELSLSCESYRRAQKIFSQVDPMAAAQAMLRLGSCYSKLGSLPEAPAAFREALRLIADRPNSGALRADILREIGWWLRLEGKPVDALWVLAETIDTGHSALGISDRLGTVYTDLGEFVLARSYYRRALQQARAATAEEAHVRLNLCRLEELAANVEAGLEHCRVARDIFAALHMSSARAQALLLTARLIRHSDLKQALTLAEQALAAVEHQRPQIGPIEQRSAFLAKRLDAHELAIELLMELNQQQPGAGWARRALQISELTRTRTLLDLLRAKEVTAEGRGASGPESEAVELRANIAILSQALANEASESASWMKRYTELAVMNEKLVFLRGQRASKSFADSLLESPISLDVNAIQQFLDPQTLLLVYHLQQRQAFLWLVHRGGIEGRLLGSASRIQSRAESWYQLLADLGAAPWIEDVERQRASLLSDDLLAPIAEQLGGYRRLVVVADGALARIPFAAMPAPGTNAEGYPMIVSHELVSLPSVGVLLTLRQQAAERRPAKGLLAVVADPVYRFASKEAAKLDLLSPELTYPRLLGSAEEARALIKLAAPGAVLLLDRFDANLSRVIGGALQGYRIVHFATHAETRLGRNHSLGLVLSQFDPDGVAIDGLLSLQKLYGLNLPAELVVLSACGTALGREIRGEGLIGLTRGFMHAGTPRIVVSLWDVQDWAAKEMMVGFYRALLRDRRPPADALRNSQLEMWQAGHPPAVWGSFMLQGDWRAFSVTP